MFIFVFQRSSIGLSGRRVHSGQIREAELCDELNFSLLLFTVESVEFIYALHRYQITFDKEKFIGTFLLMDTGS